MPHIVLTAEQARILEQTTLPQRFPLVHDNALVDSGVLLVLGRSDGPRITGVETTADPAQTSGRLAEQRRGGWFGRWHPPA